MAVDSTIEEHVDDAVARIAAAFTDWEVFRVDQLFQSQKWEYKSQQVFIGFEAGENVDYQTGETWMNAQMFAYMRIPLKYPDPWQTCAGNAARLAAWLKGKGFKHSGVATFDRIYHVGIDPGTGDTRAGEASDPGEGVVFQVEWAVQVLVDGEGVDAVDNEVNRIYGTGDPYDLVQVTYGHSADSVDSPSGDQVID